MTTRRSSARLTSYYGDLTVDGRAIPYGSGELPADFVLRLTELKDASGLTWNGFAEALGVDRKQVLRWRNGTEPCGGAMLSLLRLASRIPGGLEILMRDSSQMSLWGG